MSGITCIGLAHVEPHGKVNKRSETNLPSKQQQTPCLPLLWHLHATCMSATCRLALGKYRVYSPHLNSLGPSFLGCGQFLAMCPFSPQLKHGPPSLPPPRLRFLGSPLPRPLGASLPSLLLFFPFPPPLLSRDAPSSASRAWRKVLSQNCPGTGLKLKIFPDKSSQRFLHAMRPREGNHEWATARTHRSNSSYMTASRNELFSLEPPAICGDAVNKGLKDCNAEHGVRTSSTDALCS